MSTPVSSATFLSNPHYTLALISKPRIPTGMLATLDFGMSLRDSSLVILFFAIITCLPPAFMAIGGANTGLRQQVQARYSFG
jgi:purine-cytosine permease-like protein